MCDGAELVHHIAGRLRLRIPAAKGDHEKLLAIQQAVRELGGVQSVDVNPRLGTLIVHYDSGLFTGFTAKLVQYATEQNLFAIGEQALEACVSDADRSLNDVLSTANRTVQAALGNLINLKELFPLAIGLYGLLFVDKAIAAAQWLNWIQFAIDTYMDLHEQQPLAEHAQTVEALFADVMAQQTQSTEALRGELTAMRAQLQAILDSVKPQ